MRCRYTFKLKSEVALSGLLHFSHGGCNFTLVSETGRLSAIQVEQAGVKFGAYPKLSPPSAGQLAKVTIPPDPLFPSIQLEMRAVRGALALWGVFDIEIEQAKSEWLPETDEERSSTDMFGVSRSVTPLGQGRPVNLPMDQIIRPLISRRSFLPLEIPLEFFRRGRIDLYEQRYIEAIYDFYFVLEYLFAEGQFTKHGTRAAMLKAAELARAIREAQGNPMPEAYQRSDDRSDFDTKYRDKSAAEIIDGILSLRGLLHHQSSTHKKNWNPSTPAPFKVDAFFLCAVSHAAVLDLSCALTFEPEEDAAFKSTQVFAGDGRRINWVPIPERPDQGKSKP